MLLYCSFTCLNWVFFFHRAVVTRSKRCCAFPNAEDPAPFLMNVYVRRVTAIQEQHKVLKQRSLCRKFLHPMTCSWYWEQALG